MRKLDFLSNSPKTFIFEKSSNKTTFGGFLTLIYILIIFIMSFVYIYNYLINDKYINVLLLRIVPYCQKMAFMSASFFIY